MEMLILYLLGLSLVGFGFLVTRYPMLISGYNTMSKKNREKVDIEQVSRFLRKFLIIAGVIIVGTVFLA